jgi:hypothetical protein
MIRIITVENPNQQQATIESLRDQIETLKMTLRKDRFWQIWKSDECPTVKKASNQADSQLAREMPEIFEEKKMIRRRQ